MNKTCENCKWWERFENSNERWKDFGECNNPLFKDSIWSSWDPRQHLDCITYSEDTSFGKDFGCVKWEGK